MSQEEKYVGNDLYQIVWVGNSGVECRAVDWVRSQGYTVEYNHSEYFQESMNWEAVVRYKKPYGSSHQSSSHKPLFWRGGR